MAKLSKAALNGDEQVQQLMMGANQEELARALGLPAQQVAAMMGGGTKQALRRAAGSAHASKAFKKMTGMSL